MIKDYCNGHECSRFIFVDWNDILYNWYCEDCYNKLDEKGVEDEKTK
jgi:hypothetical protein